MDEQNFSRVIEGLGKSEKEKQRIIEKANFQAEKIVKEARVKAKEIEEKAEIQASDLKNKLIEEANKEITSEEEKIFRAAEALAQKLSAKKISKKEMQKISSKIID